MSAKLLVAVASVLIVALLVFTAVRAQPDQAPPSAAGRFFPAPESSGSAPITETAAPASASETSVPTPTAEAPAPKPETETPRIFKAEQLDQLLAPIALYPDPLLAQILMAATYPLEVVKADRWLQNPSHANLRGDQLAGAIEAEAWDPSVKSLVPFPHILRMMDEQLDWTEQLGNAVLAQQADVMDSIQGLRNQAAAAGTLWSNAQQRVTTEGQGIVIEPASPELIYPPVYSSAVYGPWPYPDYPPFDMFPPGPDFGLSAPFGIGFGLGFVVIRPLSHWCAFDWRQRQIRLDVDRFNALNRHIPGIETSTWQHDPSRLSVHSRDFAFRTPFRVFRASAISTATIPRVNMPSVAPSAPTATQRWASPAFALVGQAPMAVLRSAPRSFALVGRGLQAPIESRPGLTGRQIMLPIMPRYLAPPIVPRTVARSTAPASGGGVRFAGASHR